MNQYNGIQLNPVGRSFNDQYNVPDTSLTQNSTVRNNPLYNLIQVIFQNKQTDNIAQQIAKVGVDTKGDGIGLTHMDKKDGINLIG